MKNCRMTKLVITFLISLMVSCVAKKPIAKLDTDFDKSLTTYDFCVFGDTRTAADSSLEGTDVAFRMARNKVFAGVNSELEDEKTLFSLFTGDLIWMGGEKSYWEGPKKYLLKEQRAKIFPIPGNHETWNDTNLVNYFDFFKQLDGHHSYYFTQGRSLYLSLCTGGYIGAYSKDSSFAQDQRFTCIKATYEELAIGQFLDSLQKTMAASGDTMQNIFVQYHKPSFSFYKHPPLDSANDPVEILKEFGKKNPDLQMYVFNGHNHTTEMYKPADNMTVLVAGGGGAPQKTLTPRCLSYSCCVPDSLKLPSDKVKAIYDKKGVDEVFWKSIGLSTWTRTKRVNYWVVSVDDEKKSVTLTEKVLTFDSDASIFVDGLKMVNGKVVKE